MLLGDGAGFAAGGDGAPGEGGDHGCRDHRHIATFGAEAREHVVECIESECLAAGARTPDGTQWWDTRPMLDPHEHASEVIDMAQAALQYAIDYRIAFRHPVSPHLVRIATRIY